MSNDELQTILYEQVYQYARATTPVSMHPAVYYAHIASGRAGTHGMCPNGEPKMSETQADFYLSDPTWQGSTDGRGATQGGGSSGPGSSQPLDIQKLMVMPNTSAINSSMWYI
jgi:eukaryotic translation initiation factor 2C